MPRRAAARLRSPRGRRRAAPDAPPGRPDVIVDFLFEEGLFFIAVKNIGTRPALRVSVRFDQRLTGAGGDREISALPLFKNIEYLAPQKTITAFLDTSAAYFARNEPTKIAAHVAFRDPVGHRYAQTLRHDLEIYRAIGYVARPARAPGGGGPPAGERAAAPGLLADGVGPIEEFRGGGGP
ncbi:MAG TPA: hypothetical protein VJT32_05060 [bacterium]|nr:hypothetical protein [bacterium]